MHGKEGRNFLRSVRATANDDLSTLLGYVQGYLNEEAAAQAQKGTSPDNAIALVAGRSDPTGPLTTLIQKQDDILEAIKALTLAIGNNNAANIDQAEGVRVEIKRSLAVDSLASIVGSGY